MNKNDLTRLYIACDIAAREEILKMLNGEVPLPVIPLPKVLLDELRKNGTIKENEEKGE